MTGFVGLISGLAAGPLPGPPRPAGPPRPRPAGAPGAPLGAGGNGTTPPPPLPY